MDRAGLLTHRKDGAVLEMPGLEVDSLLALLAFLGLLRSLEKSRPEWAPRGSWGGPPWQARLHLSEVVDEATVANAAGEGVEKLAADFDVDGRNNVDFEVEDFRTYASRSRGKDTAAALAVALTAECPARKDKPLQAGPFVMMFGQGHQNFLDRLVAVSRGELPNRLKKKKPPPDMRDPKKIAEALFRPWTRTDDADAFRWDPDEDQRYALRHGDPSGDGAAPTVHGANRLAAIGFLSFPCIPRQRRMGAPGFVRTAEPCFVWPVWTEPLSRVAVERLLAHPDVLGLRLPEMRALGVGEIYRARRIANGKFMNVTRGLPTVKSTPND